MYFHVFQIFSVISNGFQEVFNDLLISTPPESMSGFSSSTRPPTVSLAMRFSSSFTSMALGPLAAAGPAAPAGAIWLAVKSAIEAMVG